MPTTLRLPAGFIDRFRGGDIMQGPVDKARLDATGYPGAYDVRQAVDSAAVTKVFGKGSTYLLTFDFDGQRLHDALDCIDDYAVTYAEASLEERSEPGLSRDDRFAYNDADRELQACRKVLARITKIRRAVANV